MENYTKIQDLRRSFIELVEAGILTNDDKHSSIKNLIEKLDYMTLKIEENIELKGCISNNWGQIPENMNAQGRLGLGYEGTLAQPVYHGISHTSQPNHFYLKQ